MKKLTGIIAILMFAFATAAFADGIKCDSVKDADEYFAHGETALAKSCIEDVIKAEPGNTRAHFAKGKYALMTGEPAVAKTKFSAGDVKARYGDDIFKAYKDLGDTATKDGNVTAAGDLYEEALVYKPSVRQSIANEMFEAGKKSSNPRGYFTVAIRLDASMAQKTAQIWNGLSQKATSEEKKIDLLGEAAKDDPATFQKIHLDTAEAAGRRELEKAKKYARTVGQEKATAQHKTLARRFFSGTPSEGMVEKELPEVKVFTPGTYTFSIKAGEQTPWKISFPSGKISHYNISSADYNYKISFEGGPTIKDGPTVKYPPNMYTFRFIAISDQPKIEMVVTQE